jgi:hypothetical protein
MSFKLTRNQARLLQEAKDKLRITWDEEDAHIWRLVEAAMAELDGMFRKRFDYMRPGIVKTLMLEHVFYNRNNALHEFQNAYMKELTALGLAAATGRYSDAPGG